MSIESSGFCLSCHFHQNRTVSLCFVPILYLITELYRYFQLNALEGRLIPDNPTLDNLTRSSCPGWGAFFGQLGPLFPLILDKIVILCIDYAFINTLYQIVVLQPILIKL